MAKPLGLVGVLSTRRAGAHPFPEGGYFRQLMKAGRRLGIRVIAFSPLDINWANGTVLGFTHNGSSWQAGRYPVPRIVYDRIFASRGHWQRYWSNARRMRQTYRVRFMGRGLHGKWQFYRIARRVPELKPHIPETHVITGTGIVLAMLNRHRTVYLKPVFGSGGRGIIRVTRRGSMYLVKMSGGGRRTLSAAELPAVLAGTGRRYVVQQGLDLAYLQGSPYDVRSIVQKNGEGEWQVTGKAARIGRRHSITSNLHTGGHARTVQAVLESYFPDRAAEIEQEIDSLAIQVAQVMERRAGPLCDLGLDMGIDRQGKVWLIEVNSKPGRKVFRLTRDREARRLSIETPMAYARYLIERRNKGRKSQ